MNQERISLIVMIALAVLASIPQIPVDAQIWGALLAIIGVVGGVMINYRDITQRIVVYVIALALPSVDNTLTSIWVVGPWLNTLFDNLALGLQGVAVGLLVMALLARIQGAGPATS